eukprot:c8743_g1_i3.p1 GENE.c8743_g1_i3~~c8743_g1_i3.p1  ORF type:complete len:354 (-),score=65.30 c8743_g1_i3:1137-2198(-)
MTHKVAIVGSGNWGSVISIIAGENVLKRPDLFHSEVRMWVFEEILESEDSRFSGRKLTEVINEFHENPKYLPGKSLPENVVADPDVIHSVADADLLVFVVPHQFLDRILSQIHPHVKPNAVAISLIKGISFDEKGMVLISDVINKVLGIECCVLMGANVASQVADGDPAESTIGYRTRDSANLFHALFDKPRFRINCVKDVEGVELCGALKNIVAIAAGFCDGLGFQDNTKAAIVRVGLIEMIRFATHFFPPGDPQTYLESCGVADLITTCYAGRNRKVAEAFVKTGRPIEELEDEMLAGQKLQGTLTAKEVYPILVREGLLPRFPLFRLVYEILFAGLPAAQIVDALEPLQV